MNHISKLPPKTKVAIFKGKEIRKTIYNNEWWFSIADVIDVLTDSTDTRQYIKKMRQRDPQLESYWGTICTPLELLAPEWNIALFQRFCCRRLCSIAVWMLRAQNRPWPPANARRLKAACLRFAYPSGTSPNRNPLSIVKPFEISDKTWETGQIKRKNNIF